MKASKIVLPLLVSGALAACVVLLLRHHVQYKGIVEDLSSWGAFFNVFGVVYAIVAGFLLVTVLNRYGTLNQRIEDELNAISMKEWEEMSDPRTRMNSDTSEDLYEVMRKGKKIQVSDSVVLSALVDNISEITKLRTRRIALSNERLPPRLRILIIFMSVALVVAFVLLGVRGVFTHVFMLATLTISIHLLYMIIEDLDHPFYGVWNIDRTPLDELVETFEKELKSN